MNSLRVMGRGLKVIALSGLCILVAVLGTAWLFFGWAIGSAFSDHPAIVAIGAMVWVLSWAYMIGKGRVDDF